MASATLSANTVSDGAELVIQSFLELPSQQSSRSLKDELKEHLKPAISGFQVYITSDVAVEITLFRTEADHWETNSTSDIDNVFKPFFRCNMWTRWNPS